MIQTRMSFCFLSHKRKEEERKGGREGRPTGTTQTNPLPNFQVVLALPEGPPLLSSPLGRGAAGVEGGDGQ